MAPAPTLLLSVGSSLLIGLSLSSFCVAMCRDSHVRAKLDRRLARLRRDLEFVRAGISPGRLFVLQGIGVVLALCGSLHNPIWLLALAAVSIAPSLLLKQAKERRVQAIERQVEGWMTMLARALEAAPSLGEAVEVSVNMVDAPLNQELKVVVSEMHLGSSLDEALENWERRCGSRVLSLALGTIKVGRQTGGRLGDVLRSSAESLREMERLEGLVRTKTAEGRAQAWVIAVVPFPLYFLVRWGDPHYFDAFESTGLGHVFVAIAVALWVAAVLSARKILAVKI